MPPQPLQSLQRRVLPGKAAYFFRVKLPAQHRPQQEVAQIGHQRKIVRGGKAPGRQPQGHQPGEGKALAPEPQPQPYQQHTQRGQQPLRASAKHRPEQHAAAQTVQHSEIDDNILPSQAGQIHENRGGGAQKAAAKDRQSPLQAVPPQRDADAGDQQKQGAVVVFKQQIPHWLLPRHHAEEVHQIVNKVDTDHPQQRRSPQGVQLPDPPLHFTPEAALASSSSTR